MGLYDVFEGGVGGREWFLLGDDNKNAKINMDLGSYF